MQAPPWYRPPLLWCGLGLAILAIPERWEGPLLLEISAGHALRLADAVGLVPLLVGIHWIEWGLWKRRSTLWFWCGEHPAGMTGVAFGAGLGLGLLIASAFSGFYWWWAVGAVVFAAAMAILVWLSAR